MSDAAFAAKPAPRCQARIVPSDYTTIDISPRSNLQGLITRLGITRGEADAALKALKARAELSSVPELSRLIVVRRPDACNASRAELVSLTLATPRVGEVTVVRDIGGGFSAQADARRYVFHLRIAGTLDNTELEQGLIAAGIPASVAEQAADSFAADDEVPSGVLSNVDFDVVYQVSMSTQGGGESVQADLTVAELSYDGRGRRVYYYKPDNGGAAEPLDGYGRPLVASNGAQLTNPVPEGKLTSPFGWRKHPVLHVPKFHVGVDFSAPKGTPVRAAADGVVTLVTTHRTYGRYIKIGHSPHLETGYAHLANFIPNLKAGQTVRKGDVIGYVGRTGLASGNHLLFEVLVDGKHVDPMAHEIEAVSGGPADAQEKMRFIQLADSIRDSTPVISGDL